jgi:archaellum component FlaF (FlaF/FlaG flagellin family)
MKNTSVSFSIGKEPPDNCDAQRSDPNFGLIAIADGATQSVFAEEWANLLVDGFCQSQEKEPCKYIQDNAQAWLKPLQDEWMPLYEQARNKLSDPNGKTWSPLKSGNHRVNSAASTFVGVQLFPVKANRKGKWQSVAIGDSCLFHFRQINHKYELLKAFPLEKSQDFSTATHAFNSNPKYSALIKEKPVFFEGDYQLKDTFLLATDALAQWILKNREAGKDDWQKLLTINENEQDEFEQMVDNLRKNNEIVFDDTTFCRMQVVASPEKRRTITKTIPPGINLELSSKNQTHESLVCFDLKPAINIRGFTTNSNSLSFVCKSPNISTPQKTKGTKFKLPEWAKPYIAISLCVFVILAALYIIANSLFVAIRKLNNKVDTISNDVSTIVVQDTKTAEIANVETQEKSIAVEQRIDGKTQENKVVLNKDFQDIFESSSTVDFWVQLPDKYFVPGDNQPTKTITKKAQIWQRRGNNRPRDDDFAGWLMPGTYLFKGDGAFSIDNPYDAQIRTVELRLSKKQ